MQKELLFLKNASIVLPDRVLKGTLVIEDGRVKSVSAGDIEGIPSGADVVDMAGKILMPGLVDSHVHMWDPSPQNYREDWLHGSQAAAAGGITTIVEMPLSVPPVTDRAGFEIKKKTAEAQSVVDFALWGGLIPSCIDNMEELHKLGCVAYKGFMSFANPDYPQITDGHLVRGMQKAVKFDGLIGLHAENAEVADFGSRAMLEADCPDEAMHDEARPWWSEVEAIQRAVLFSKATGARIYICHLASARGGDVLRQAKLERVPVTVETCPHYLLFDKTILREKKSFAKCNPPYRDRANLEELWQYIFDGTIDTIGSDHGPYTDEEKTKEGNFWKEYSGFGGYDAMLAALYTEGVHKRNLPLPRLAELLCSNAAKAFRLFPRKGTLLPGADADIAVIDPNEEWTYDGMKSFSKTKSSRGLYQGQTFKGRVVATYVRGRLVYKDGEITAQPGFGAYVPRGK